MLHTDETDITVDLRTPGDQSTVGVARRMVRDGTPVMALGSVIAGIAAYAFQVIGGRALGEIGFAPVASLLSIHSLILAVLLTPVELLTVRRLTLRRGGAPDEHDRRSIIITIAVSLAVMVVFVETTIDRFFGGNQIYMVIGAAVVATHAIFALGRGYLAGEGRYVAYGTASGSAALVRVALAIGVVIGSAGAATAEGLSWAIALPPLVILAWRPFVRRQRRRVPARAGSGSLMAGFVLAGAISQAFVLAGPLVAGALEPDPMAVDAVVSIVFVTFSLARAPLLLAQNLAARLLAGLTKLVAATDYGQLRSWSRRLGFAGLVAAPLSYVAGAWLGPPVIGLLFGDSFRPDPTLAGLAVAGCALAAASVFLDQVLIALGATGKLATAWTIALAVAGGTLFLVPGDPGIRVGTAMLVGELAALLVVMIAAEISSPESPDTAYDLAKRGIDILTAGTLLVLTAPIQLALAIAIKLDTAGPVLFRQPRLGKNDRPFQMVKFRSMISDADDQMLYAHLSKVAQLGYVRPETESTGPQLYIDDDPRVTRVGRFLRKTSLDELPNLWNVLRGDMSLVGPRPLVPAEVALLGHEAQARSRVRPGMTGLAQVQGGSELTFSERAYWDLEYVERRSLLLDVKILVKTPLAALGRRG